jgi:hypothetical protein
MSCGIDNSRTSDDVAPPLAQFHQPSRGLGPLGFRAGGLPVAAHFLARRGARFARAALASNHLLEPR